jgi:N-acyl-D-amino-acid deacylase
LWQSYGIEQDWTTMAGYRERLQSARPSVNVVPLVGHNTVRACVMGYADRAPDAGEMERMASLVEAALDDGAFGMSSGLIYVPGCFCKTGELIELATVCARHDALYTTHMRNESDRVEEALAEALRIGRESGARVQISHLKTSGRQNWSKIDRLIGMIEQARADGLDVTADRYPYVAGWTDLDIVLPKWALDGGAEAQLARLRDPAARARMRDEILRTRGADSWGEVMVAGVRSDANKPLEGKTVAEVAAMQRKEPVDALLDLLVVEELHAGGIFFGMSEANLERFLQQPWMMIGSDSAGRAHYGVLRTGHPHPRTFGTFPRVLSAYAGKPALQVEEAIRKMTALPAKKFGLRGRGIIERGAFADLVVFDPATLRDRSTYAQPWQYPTGIETVVVNGQVTFHGGEHTNAAAGRVLGRTR